MAWSATPTHGTISSTFVLAINYTAALSSGYISGDRIEKNLFIPELLDSSGIFYGCNPLGTTNFEGVKTICRHIGRLSLQLGTKNKRFLGNS